MFITGKAGTGKTTTANKLKSQLQPHQYKICTPTHKSSLLYEDAQTIYALLNINCLPWNEHVNPLACIVCDYVTIYILLQVYTPVNVY